MEENKNDNDNDIQSNKFDNLNSKIFIVHGREEGLLNAVALLITNQGLTPIILSEQSDQGITIIEKIEYNSDVNAAICLFTPDDEGKLKKMPNTNPEQDKMWYLKPDILLVN